ncbi:MAG: hypothetical protein KJ799_06330 [Bacteroidetes bacterium]|nr:hypothetical protein [Bacteroidota bacterium]MBU2506325.1 hypothetical protein [Bacteroidota bacterium]
MSVKKNSFLPNLIAGSAIIFFALLIYLLSLTEIKSLNKEKDLLEAKRAGQMNEVEMKLVEIQKLSAEDRIVTYAKENLGLIKSEKSFDVITIELSKIEKVERIINSKYE